MKELQLLNLRIAGFNLRYTQSIRCPITDDIILLDMLGDYTAVKGAWASITRKKQNIWALGGHVKLNRDMGHEIVKNQLPCRLHNWTIVSRQAMPKKLLPDHDVYVWTNDTDHQYQDREDNEPPERFMSLMAEAIPFPTKPEWAHYLWNYARPHRTSKPLIHRLVDTTQCSAYKIETDPGRWHGLIQMGLEDNKLS